MIGLCISSLTSLILAAFLCGCDVTTSQIGSDFFNSGSLDISSIDSVTARLSTVRFDSLPTSDVSRVLAGGYTDDRLGDVRASTYFLPSMASERPDPGTTSLIRLSIVLRYDGYSYYDTTTSLTLNVYQLRSELKQRSDGRLYNSSAPVFDTNALGSLTFFPSPHRDSIEITLNHVFAADYYEKATSGTSTFADATEFQKYVKGFAIVPGDGSSCVLGFSTGVEVRLHYIDRSTVPSSEKYIAYPASSGLTFTGIAADRENSKLPTEIQWRSRISSSITDGESYVQAGEGLATRIDLASLPELNQFENFYPTRAVLRIVPVHQSYGKHTPLPEVLNIFLVDRRNDVIGEYTLDASLVRDPTMDRDTRYELDVTAFLKRQMERDDLNEDALLLLLPDQEFRSRADRVHFSQRQSKLIIYYATILNR